MAPGESCGPAAPEEAGTRGRAGRFTSAARAAAPAGVITPEFNISEEPLAERVLRQVRSGQLDESRLLPSAEKRARDVGKKLCCLATRGLGELLTRGDVCHVHADRAAAERCGVLLGGARPSGSGSMRSGPRSTARGVVADERRERLTAWRHAPDRGAKWRHGGGIVMSYQDTFEHILAALYDAMLDDARWPAASALIDEACGITGNDLMVGEGPKDDVQADFVGVYSRGQRREDLEREYLENYHPTDERVPRFRQLPDSRPTHVTDLYTAEELKTSPTYNEALARAGQQDAVNTRLDGPDGSHIAWALGDPVDSDGWGSSRVAMVTGLLPHIRPVRPGPAGAGPRRSAEHDRDRPARQPADRRFPPGPAGPHHRGQRPRPEHPAGGRRVVGPGRDAPRPRAGRPGPSSSGCWATRCRPPARPRSVGRCCSAARLCCRRSWCTSSRWASLNRTTERGPSPRWC